MLYESHRSPSTSWADDEHRLRAIDFKHATDLSVSCAIGDKHAMDEKASCAIDFKHAIDMRVSCAVDF